MKKLTDQEFYDLLDKYLAGDCTVEEARQIDQFYEDNQLYNQGSESWPVDQRLSVKASTRKALLTKVGSSDSRRTIYRRLVYGVAASVLLVACIALFWKNGQPPLLPEVEQVVSVAKRGQKKTVILPDGTKVKLNAESELSFPSKFEAGIRQVSLLGEAFFEVKRDINAPFVIKSGEMETTVLGTSFNVRAYPGEATKSVTVATGKVRVSTSRGLAPVELEVSEQALLSTGADAFVKQSVNLQSFLDWKDGVLRFDDVSVSSAAKIIERWYGVDIDLQSTVADECYFTASFENESMQNVLKSIKLIKGIGYEIMEDKKVIITLKNCE